MTPRSSQCSPFFAKALTASLLGDGEMKVKDGQGNWVPLYSHFCDFSLDGAQREYEDLYYKFEEHERAREMVRRLGLDGTGEVA